MMNDRLQTVLVFLRQQDRILRAHKKTGHGQGVWNGIGGKVEAGESPDEAAKRECMEEIGVTITSMQKHGLLKFYQEPLIDQYSNLDAHIYVCSQWEGQPQESPEVAPRWFNVTDIPYQEMWPDDQYWLPLIVQGKSIRGTFYFDDNNNLTKYNIDEL